MKLLTVFTPTYNRAYCLSNLYSSLKEQTDKDFVWLVIDDGSSDNTEELVSSFIKENELDIVYIKKENGGKHTAHNKALELCDTELFLCVDSDDMLTENAVAVIRSHYNEVKDEKLLGMYMRRVTQNGEIIGSEYPEGVSRVGIVDLYYKYGFFGDTAIVLKTQLVKNVRFPVFSEERFVTESVFYSLLNEIAPMALFSDGIYVSEYLDDGYTRNTERLFVNNPIGWALSCRFQAFYDKRFISRTKMYSQYLALLKCFKIKAAVVNLCKKPNFFVRTMACMILPHYIKLFERLKTKYGK